MHLCESNAARFTGFAPLYDEARPAMPAAATALLIRYLGRAPETVVDLGCGTGLSSLAWRDRCRRLIGVDPSGDMLAVARQRETAGVEFLQAFADRTGLPDNTADIVVCSQSFHWMEPHSTLKEAARILRPGGVFAAVDCDWPPVCGWEAEAAYERLTAAVDERIAAEPSLEGGVRRWDKRRHLDNIRQSGRFRYARELVLLHREEGTADRVIALAMSQGGLQSVLKKDSASLAAPLKDFEDAVRSCLGAGSFPLDFCYRVRLGVV